MGYFSRSTSRDSWISTYTLHHLTDEEKISFITDLILLLKKDGNIFIGDISFETREKLDTCRQESIEYWDEDEYYFVYDEISSLLKVQCEFYPISHCGGVFIISEWQTFLSKLQHFTFATSWILSVTKITNVQFYEGCDIEEQLCTELFFYFITIIFAATCRFLLSIFHLGKVNCLPAYCLPYNSLTFDNSINVDGFKLAQFIHSFNFKWFITSVALGTIDLLSEEFVFILTGSCDPRISGLNHE